MVAGLIVLGALTDIRNSRLNANRMLRARKVVSYVGERIESEHIPADTKDQPDTWLEILCQDKVILTYFID